MSVQLHERGFVDVLTQISIKAVLEEQQLELSSPANWYIQAVKHLTILTT